MSDKSDFLWNVHSYTNEYIRFADAKASVVIAWAGAVLGTLVASKTYANFWDNKLWTSGTMFMAWVTLLSFFLLAASFVVAILTIAPRLKYDGKALKGLIFWEVVQTFSNGEAYAQAVKDCTDLDSRVAQHVYELASVAHGKYAKVTYNIWLAGAGTLLAIVAIFAQ